MPSPRGVAPLSSGPTLLITFDGDELKVLLEEILGRVRKDDPVRGRWDVRGDVAKVWVDASSLAIGAAVEVDRDIIEDASWLRPEGSSHINMAELDAVIKGPGPGMAHEESGVSDRFFHSLPLG